MDEQMDAKLEIFIPGKPLSLGDTIAILSAIEVALVWSRIELMRRKEDELLEKWIATNRADDELRKEYDFADRAVEKINDSYGSFLTRKYGEVYRVAAEQAQRTIVDWATNAAIAQGFVRDYIVGGVDDEQMIRRKARYRRPDVHDMAYELRAFMPRVEFFSSGDISNYLFSMGIGRGGFDFHDFHAWIKEEFRTDLIPVSKVETTRSISYYLDIVNLMSIFGMQHMPVAKDLVGFSVGVLKEWAGEQIAGRMRDRNPPQPPPEVKIALRDKTIKKFEWESDGKTQRLVFVRE